MPGMEIKVVDEQRRELPAGQVGELVCRSDSVMLGYYRAPEVTAEVIDNHERDRDLSGALALQLHAGPPMTAQFKDIRLRRLKMPGR